MRSESARGASLILLAAAGYFLSASLAYAFGVRGIVVLWIPSGIMLAVLVMLRIRDWPLALMGGYGGNVVADLVEGTGLALSLGASLANSTEVLVAASVVRRLVGPSVSLASLREVTVLIIGAAVISNGLTAFMGAAVLHLAYDAPFAGAWLTWWVGDGLGMLIVAPVIITLPRAWHAARPRWPLRGRDLEAIILTLLTPAVALYVFAADRGQAHAVTPSPYMAFPFLFWAGLRLGPAGATIATLAVSGIALWNTALDGGPFADLSRPPLDQAFDVYTFLGLAAVSGLVPAAALAERAAAVDGIRALNEELEQRVVERTAALQASEVQFRTLATTAHDAIIAADGQGWIRYFNPAAERIFGYSAAEVVGAPLTVLMPERFHEAHRTGLARYRATGQAHVLGRTVELAGRRKDGAEFPLELSLASRAPYGAPTFIGIIRDITERKQVEQQIHLYAAQLEAANRELEAFSYSVSHDLRAPLRSIHGFSQALLEDYADRFDQRGVHFLGRVRAAVERMSELIDDLLELSRATRAEMYREKVELSRLAGQISAELAATDPARRVEFRIIGGVTCTGDQRLLTLMMRNLLENAWKFTGKRDRSVIEFGVTQGAESAFFVRDNGAGLDMTYADKLFQPFQRLHSASDFPGTGIGLALVQRIIHRHGGRVWVEGAVDHGATFYFTLPDA